MGDKKLDEGLNLKPLRTYKSDVEETLKKEGGSLLDIVAAEEKKRFSNLTAEKNAPKTLAWMKSAILASVVLLVAGGIIFWSIKTFLTKKTPVNESGLAERLLISVERERPIDITGMDREKIIGELVKERDSGKTESGLTAIYFTTASADGKKSILTTGEFLETIDAEAPNAFIRSVSPDFLFGFLGRGGNQPFVIFKTDDYPSAFSAMLEWERVMEKRIGEIFIKTGARTGIIKKATTTEEIASNAGDFRDEIIKSRDARVLRGDNGKTVFLYAFPDASTAVMTTDAETLVEIANRLVKKKQGQ